MGVSNQSLIEVPTMLNYSDENRVWAMALGHTLVFLGVKTETSESLKISNWMICDFANKLLD